MPVFVRDEGGLDERSIGLLFLLNSLTIIAFQIPVARRQEGRRRLATFARMGALFAAGWLLVLGAGAAAGRGALPLAVFAILVISWAECLYDAVQGPLTADLARGGLAGRYMALNGFSWQLGFIVGPAAGAALLGAQPFALWPAAAVVCLAAAGGALVLERRLPAELRRSPERAAAA